MYPNDHTLFELARRLSGGAPLSSPRVREDLESALRTIVRGALRTGAGDADVVRWVRGRINPDRPVDPALAAPPLARELADRVLERLDPKSGRETVVGL